MGLIAVVSVSVGLTTLERMHQLPPRIIAEILSANMIVGMLRLARGMVGMIEASTTRRPLMP